MLAVSPLTRSVKDERESQIQKFSVEKTELEEFKSGNLLDSIDFDDIFVGISDGDVLPNLEMDFSVGDLGHKSEMKSEDEKSGNSAGEPVSVSGSGSDVGFGSSSVIQGGEEAESEKEESVVNNPSRKATDKSRKSSSLSRNPPRKKKPKVDWTPELHRRFVQAVEKLGLDKAVPSRILEIMGVDNLTRHNIASHLQKYRSHRKHLVAREAEATSWGQRRQMSAARGGAAQRGVINWNAPPTMGFPSVPPTPYFRPLHVWGHPSVDQSMMPVWPQHPSPPAPPSDPSFWHPHHHFRFPSPPVAGVPFPGVYNVEHGIGVPARQAPPQPPSDVHPTKESIDAAIGDVLAKPWLPLPLGLKPPSIDTVMAELHRQGVPKIPPIASSY